MIFKSLLLTLGLFQNQEQSSVLSKNVTNATDVCLVSDASTFQSPLKKPLQEFHGMDFFKYAIPVSCVLSALVFYGENLHTKAVIEELNKESKKKLEIWV